MTKVVFAKTSCKSASAKLIDDRLEKADNDHIYIAYDALYNDYGVSDDKSDGLFAEKHEFQLDKIKGRSVVMKSETDIRKVVKTSEFLNCILPFANKVVQIFDVIEGNDIFVYGVMDTDTHDKIYILEDHILCDANDHAQIEPLDCEGTGWKLEAQNLDTMQLDTSKLKPSPMETWKALFASVESFTSVASPQMRAYAAGQLYGLSERLMQEMLDTLKETPASEK